MDYRPTMDSGLWKLDIVRFVVDGKPWVSVSLWGVLSLIIRYEPSDSRFCIDDLVQYLLDGCIAGVQIDERDFFIHCWC